MVFNQARTRAASKTPRGGSTAPSRAAKYVHWRDSTASAEASARHPEQKARLRQRAIGWRSDDAAECPVAVQAGVDGKLIEHKCLRFWRESSHGQGRGRFQILRLGADQMEHDGRQTGRFDVLRQARHLGRKGTQRRVAAAEIDDGGLLFDNAVLNQILEPGHDACWGVRVGTRHIGKVTRKRRITRIDVGQDGRAAVGDGHLRDPPKQCGLAGFAATRREHDPSFARQVNALLDFGFQLRA